MSPESADTRLLRQSSWPVIEPFHEVIRDLLCTVTVSMIHQRLRDKRGRLSTKGPAVAPRRQSQLHPVPPVSRILCSADPHST